MGAGPTISQQKLFAAAGGNPDMLEILQQLANVNTQTQAAIGTTPVTSAVTAGSPNPAAPVPPQATGSVSILGGAYVVQITNPGAKNPISALQAAQAAGNAGPLSPVQPVKAIFHQIRASTSVAFNVNSNTQTFGGNTGSAQVYWTITGLGSGTWYFQFRSSYDGINFNTWKNANGGSALGGFINQVTTEAAENSDWALFNLPGSLIAGIGEGFVPDQGIFGLAEQLFSSGLFAIAGPNGFVAQNNGVYGVTLCDVDLQEGSGPVAGIPDFPVEIRMTYGIFDSDNQSPGSANVFGIAVNPENENVTFYSAPDNSAVWAVLRLPGGASIAIGQGKNSDGTTIYVPSEAPFLNATRMMSICSLTDAVDSSGLVIQGYNKAQLSGFTMQASALSSGGSVVPVKANWLAIGWQQGTDVQIVGGFPWLKINLQGGHAIYIGAGQVPSGAFVTFPPGCTVANSLSIAIPAGTTPSGNHLRGVSQCAFIGQVPFLQYTDNSNFWDGPVQWMVAAWI